MKTQQFCSTLAFLLLGWSTAQAAAPRPLAEDAAHLCRTTVERFDSCSTEKDEDLEMRVGLCEEAARKSPDCKAALQEMAACLAGKSCEETSYETDENPCREEIEDFIDICEAAIEDSEDALYLLEKDN